jgi:hypothetical protein
MRTAASKLLNLALLLIAATTLVAGCGKKDDPIAQAEKKDVAKGVAFVAVVSERANFIGQPITQLGNFASLPNVNASVDAAPRQHQ